MLEFKLILEGILLGGIYALVASGLTLIFGVMKILNLAHGEFMMLAMYFTYFLYTIFKIDPFLSLFIVTPLLFCIGMVYWKTVMDRLLKAPPINQLLVTVGVMIFLQNLATFLWTSDYKSLTGYRAIVLSIDGLRIVAPRLISFVLAVSLIGILYLLLIKTRWGRAVRACSQDVEAAMMIGVNTSQIRLTSLAVGIALAGIAGSVTTTTYYVFPTVGLHYLLIALVVVVLGGIGSILGAFISGFMLGIVESLTAYYITTQLKELGVFIIFILTLLIKPQGLFKGE